MLQNYIFNKWQYEITKNVGEGLKGYGYTVNIYKNDILVNTCGAFGVQSIAESYIQKYIIENEHNIDLNEED